MRKVTLCIEYLVDDNDQSSSLTLDLTTNERSVSKHMLLGMLIHATELVRKDILDNSKAPSVIKAGDGPITIN